MLSKSQYVRGLQCHKSLWLYKNRPELRESPDAQTKALFQTGHTVGALACKLFPGGVEIEFNADDFDSMVEKTSHLINQGTEIIYEATFKERGIFAMADILVKNGDAWDIYEVKASTNVKPYHLDDAAIQWFALTNTIPLHKAYIVHINNQYERHESLDIQALFSIEDVTDFVLSKQDQIPSLLNTMETMIKGIEPAINIGPQCSAPHDCDFLNHCWKHIPERSVFNLYRLSGTRKFDLYRQDKIEFKDLSLDDSLTKIQTIQINCDRLNQPHIDTDVIDTFLHTLEYPLNFFDFETFQEAVPRFNGQRPYMQIPFQYSLHILNEDAELDHKEFLGDEFSDPRELLIQHMLQDITPSGSIMAFNMAFEKRMISELAIAYPKYSNSLMKLHDRFVDLLDPFRKLGYYHPDFNGSFSIKSVLPALFPNDPELSYKQLDIQDGGMAMDTFSNLHLVKDDNHRHKLRQDLLAYCHLDTLAMVKIYQKLNALLNT